MSKRKREPWPFDPKTEQLAEPFASMPHEDLKRFVAAVTGGPPPRDAYDERRIWAHDIAEMIVATLEHGTAEAEHMHRVVEGIEAAWAHITHAAPRSETRRDYLHDAGVLVQLEWGSGRLEAGKQVDVILDHIGYPHIPRERWTKALREWQGEKASRGRPRAGVARYYWHRVAYELLSGSDDELDAERWRDNFFKWRAKR